MISFWENNNPHSPKQKDTCCKNLFPPDPLCRGLQTTKTDSSGKSDTEAQQKSSETAQKSGETALAEMDLKAKMTNYRTKQKKSSGTRMEMIVHAPIDQASSHGDKSVVLVLFDPGNALWYLNFDGLKYSCDICWPHLNNGESAP